MSGKALQGRVAVVAGASRGIGMGAAVELGAAGAVVYALGRTLKPTAGIPSGSLTETVELIGSLGGTGVPIVCDCTDENELAALFGRVEADHGRLDILVNSVFSARSFGDSIGKRIWEMPVEVWRDVVDLGARSAYAASVLAAPLMIATAEGQDRPGLIVNVTGRGAVAYRYNVVYGVGKAATEKLTRDMAIDFGPCNVAVVSIWPNGAVPQPPATPETPRYSGRAVVGLATDRHLLTKSGAHFWSAELADEYDFTDELGNHHAVGTLNDEFSTPDGALKARHATT